MSKQESCLEKEIKFAFNDADTDTDILVMIVARMSACRSACHRNNFRKSRVSDVSARILAMSVSVSASWNVGLMQRTMPGARRRGRPRTAWMDIIKMWTGLTMEESIRMTDDRDKWIKYVHGVANLQI